MRARSCCCAASACSPAWSRRRSTAGCRPTRRRSAIPGSTAHDRERQAVPVARGAGRRLGRPLLTPTATTPSISCPNSRNQPAEFTETRFPVLVEKLALRTDSGGAGKRRGGLGYEKHYRALVDCRTIVTADRVRLGCYGVNGGKAGQPFCVTVDAEGAARDLGGLVDGEPVLSRPDRARRDHRRRRLGRSARTRAGARAAGRDRRQGFARRGARPNTASCSMVTCETCTVKPKRRALREKLKARPPRRSRR